MVMDPKILVVIRREVAQRKGGPNGIARIIDGVREQVKLTLDVQQGRPPILEGKLDEERLASAS